MGCRSISFKLFKRIVWKASLGKELFSPLSAFSHIAASDFSVGQQENVCSALVFLGNC